MEGGTGSSFVDGIWRYGDKRSFKFRNIKFGVESAGMPPWKDAMTDEQIETVLAFILENEARIGLEPPPPPTRISSEDYEIRVDTIVEEMRDPWSIAFVDKHRALVTEVAGSLKWLIDDRLSEKAVEGTPAVNSNVQGGLLDVAIDPAYARNGWVYLTYSDFDESNKCMIGIVRGRIEDNKWTDEERVFRAPADQYTSMNHHFGSRIAFGSDETLYFSIGDRGDQNNAQTITRAAGKIHRINRDGSIPGDNPFVGDSGAIASVFSLGHRNPQGLARHPVTGEIWATEHGPMGGDELNLIQPARNYGWPLTTFGINYDGEIISENSELPGIEPPRLHWTPSIAVCGIDFHRGGVFPKWENDLFVTSLKFHELRRVRIDGHEIVSQEVLLKNAGRLRDVEIAPDGNIYVLLNLPGKILKLSPEN
jgi:glucose/arabinose dehydrogenase